MTAWEDLARDRMALRAVGAATEPGRVESNTAVQHHGERVLAAWRQIAVLVGADPDDPMGVLTHVREKLAEGERWTARMHHLQKRIEAARKALDGEGV